MTDQRWILDDLPFGIWVGEVPSGTTAYANRAFEEILGKKPVTAGQIGDAPANYGIVDRAGNPYPVERLPFSRVLTTGGPVMVDDMVAQRPNGERVAMRAFGYPVTGGDRGISHVIVAFLDITKEVEAELEREKVEAQLRFVCNHAPIAIWATDTQGTVTMSEGAGLASLGVKSGELVGKNLLDLYAAHPTIPGHIRQGLAGESFWYTVEVGGAVYETWLTPLRGPHGEMVGLAGLSNDVSELRKLQRTAIQNDRILALGTLAASVAHEINNPLTFVLGYGDSLDRELGALEGLLDRMEGPGLLAARASLERIRDDLASVRSGTARIAGITRDLRSFSRPEDSTLSPVDVRAVAGAVLKLVAKEVEARARLIVDLGETPPVIGNEARLVQVVLNLVVNAMQALPSAPAHDNDVTVRTRSEGGRVVIEVSDSGPGIPVQDRDRVFEPFFSTKDIGQGTGLGLFVCRNIVRGLSGEIEVGDRPGGGALFRVSLPAASELVHAPSARAEPARERPASGHVLVIDDDPMVARALAQSLRAAGYRVSVAVDGEAGLETLLSTPDVDLAFCDLMMTGMSGMDLAERLAQESPGAARKLVFMTGGAFSPRARDFVTRHRDHTVDKPFDILAETRRRLGRG